MKYLIFVPFAMMIGMASADAHPWRHRCPTPPAAPVYASQTYSPYYYNDYGQYLASRPPGYGLIPIEDQTLRGIGYVIGGLAGPAAFLFAAP